jgi:hypothetical protein
MTPRTRRHAGTRAPSWDRPELTRKEHDVFSTVVSTSGDAHAPESVPRHWYRDRGVRTRVFGLTAVLLVGLLASTVAGTFFGKRASDLHAQADAAVVVQRQVEAARYNLLWAANWQNITAWKARVEGGATAAAPGGDNVAMYQDGAAGFEALFDIDRSLLDDTGRTSLEAIETNWTAMSAFNDQIFALWQQGRLDEGDAVSTGEKWDVFYVLDQAMTELETSVDARAEALRDEARAADDFTGELLLRRAGR